MVKEALGLEAVGAAKGRSRSDRRVTETLLNRDVVNLRGDCVNAELRGGQRLCTARRFTNSEVAPWVSGINFGKCLERPLRWLSGGPIV